MGNPDVASKWSHLVGRFAEAGLRLEMAERPLQGLQNPHIFQMDIRRRFRNNARSEYFRVWPGTGSRIEVLGTDRRLAQLVLLVHEPRRKFTQRVGKWALESGHASLPRQARVLYDDGRTATFEMWTPGMGKRHYLCGIDERQLFVAQLPHGVSTVADAHAALKDPMVTLYEGTARVVRQGEWFFLPATDEELEEIERGLKSHQIAIRHRASIGRAHGAIGGHPHTADQLIVVPGAPDATGRRVRRNEVFIRGRVRHIDHETVKFASWRKTIRNRERLDQLRTNGILWID